ncbi:MAG: hypothetical protein WDW36_008557 [Sanguina aurantia]
MEDKVMLKQTHLHLHAQGLRAITRLATLLPNLSVLYLYDNNIERIENLTGLSGLTHLYLQNNRLTALSGLTAVTRLQKLYCEGNYMQLISGLEACTSLEELHVSGQHLPPLPPLPPSQPTHSSTSPPAPPHRQAVQLDHAIASATHSTTTHTTPTHTTHNLTTHNLTTTTQTHASPGASPPPRAPSSLGTPPPPAGPPLEFDPASVAAISRTLRVLSCNACRLTSCAGLGGLTALRKLDLSHNSLARVCDLEPLLRHASRLAWLDLRGNPLCRAPRYREGVTLMGDSLATLDGEPILAAQREFLLRLHIQKLKAAVHLELAEEQAEAAGGIRAGGGPGQRAAQPPTAGESAGQSRGHSQGQAHGRGWEAGGGGGMGGQAARRQQGGRVLSAVSVEVCGATAARANTSIPGRDDGRGVRLGLEGLPVGR